MDKNKKIIYSILTAFIIMLLLYIGYAITKNNLQRENNHHNYKPQYKKQVQNHHITKNIKINNNLKN